jgi:hypothetical protein
LKPPPCFRPCFRRCRFHSTSTSVALVLGTGRQAGFPKAVGLCFQHSRPPTAIVSSLQLPWLLPVAVVRLHLNKFFMCCSTGEHSSFCDSRHASTTFKQHTKGSHAPCQCTPCVGGRGSS